LQAVLAAQPGLPVYVKGDRTVAYGTVVALMALIQGAGVATVGLMTESPQDGDGR
jgi:biopolymer transport protein TolR